ncbi:small GTP-binding protein, putative [Ichthyophthirius multifiliis]|uniref:Small GTP-binding protein, putative n=1 Tax=Ichthyophthirius multifiliis TaxID=5932 RepID=G0QKQ1_ICHMU|nr:small GTP-binding protein, putative [Ichthyophthirius multifiliis]EGR34205.1 small GTP-binding protein, putative [Ichthyophthirius multifiliis]|eukprot:XP_004039509.1 small GTP-binding protein, putative [Ichthyophthirius multifiliis]
MPQSILSRIFKKFDIFGSEIGLTFQKSSVFQTTFGAGISLLFLSLMMVFFWNNFLQFFNKDAVTVKIEDEFKSDPEEIQLDSSKFMFAIRAVEDNFINNPYFNISFIQRKRQFHENGIVIPEINEMMLEPCTLNHWINLPSYNISWPEIFDKKQLYNYLCPSLNDKYSVRGAWGMGQYDQLILKITKCDTIKFSTEKWRPKCRTDKEWEKYLQEKYVELEIYIPNYSVNPSKSSDYIQSYLNTADLYYYAQPYKQKKIVDIFISEFNINTDISLLPYNDIQSEKFPYFNLDGFREQNLIGDFEEFIEIFISRSYFTKLIERKFQKIDEIIAYVGGFAQAFLIFSAFMVSYYNEYIYAIELANKLYDFDNPIDKKKKLIKKVNYEKDKKMNVVQKFNIKSNFNLDMIDTPNNDNIEPLSSNSIQKINSFRFCSQNSKRLNLHKKISLYSEQYEQQLKDTESEKNTEYQHQKRVQIQERKHQEDSDIIDNNKNKFVKFNKTAIKVKNNNMNKQIMIEEIQRKKFLTKEFKYIIQKDKTIQMSYAYFINQITCGKFCKTRKVQLILKAQDQIEKDLDIFNILDRLKEVEKLKKLFLNKEQLILFNFFPKPVIDINKNEDEYIPPSRAILQEESTHNLPSVKKMKMEFAETLVKLSENPDQIMPMSEFQQVLENSTTKLLTRNLKLEEAQKSLSLYIKFIPSLQQEYFEQCTDQFINFALNMTDKHIYQVFKVQYESSFGKISEKPYNFNDLCLYICKRILGIKNKQWTLYFVECRLDTTKQIERKLLLLEMLAVIAREIQSKEIYYPKILPNILRAMMDGMKKFEKYTEKFKSDQLNADAKQFQENFENWVIDYLNRFMTFMKNLPEIKNIKKILSPNELIEVDFETGQILNKNIDPKILINTFVVFFYLDVMQGITEALDESGVFNEKNVRNFLDVSQKHFLEIIPGQIELVEIFLCQLRFNTFSNTQIPKYQNKEDDDNQSKEDNYKEPEYLGEEEEGNNKKYDWMDSEDDENEIEKKRKKNYFCQQFKFRTFRQGNQAILFIIWLNRGFYCTKKRRIISQQRKSFY